MEMSDRRREHGNDDEATTFSLASKFSTTSSNHSPPSQLWFRASKLLHASSSSSAVSHPDDLMQESLYALSVQANPHFDKGTQISHDLLSWLWRQLNSPAEKAPSESSSYYEWWAGAQLLSHLAKEMTPFELHGSVVEAMDYCVEIDQRSSTFICLCLLLCTMALEQRPQTSARGATTLNNNSTIRWKRWQSLVCETIRLYQRYVLSSSVSIMESNIRDDLWIQYILPACRHVVKVLPSDTGLPQVALMAGMIGTSTHLLVTHEEFSYSSPLSYGNNIMNDHRSDASSSHHHQKQEQRRKERKQCEQTIVAFIKAIGPVMGYRYERWVWCHPWRVHYESCHDVFLPPDNDQVQWMARKNDIGWWTERANRHELAAGMDTTWDMVGLACMAVFGYEYRPLVLSPHYIWTLWFPHVATLLLETTSYQQEAEDNDEEEEDEDDQNNEEVHHRQQPQRQQQRQVLSIDFRTEIALSLLEKLLKVVPERSFTLFTSEKNKRKIDAKKKRRPDHPIGTFQLLSNLVVAETQGRRDNDDDDDDALQEEQASKQKKVLSMMQSLLAAYEPAHQVYIIDELIQNCPHQGFECKLFDMLRPLVSRSDSPDVLWKYLDKVVDDLSDHVVEAGDKCQLIEVESLIDKVEIYVSLMTMLQLWLMVHFESPRVDMSILFSFNRALKASLQRWSQDSSVLPPDDYYRLYLLESVLEQVLQLEDNVKSEPVTASYPVMGPEPPPPRAETPPSLGDRAQTPTMGVFSAARSPPRSSNNTPTGRSSRSLSPTMSSTPSISSRSPPKSRQRLSPHGNLMTPHLHDQVPSPEQGVLDESRKRTGRRHAPSGGNSIELGLSCTRLGTARSPPRHANSSSSATASVRSSRSSSPTLPVPPTVPSRSPPEHRPRSNTNSPLVSHSAVTRGAASSASNQELRVMASSPTDSRPLSRGSLHIPNSSRNTGTDRSFHSTRSE